MTSRYEITLKEVKKYEEKLHSRLFLGLEKHNKKLFVNQYKALMLHKYRTLLINGYLFKDVWGDEVTLNWPKPTYS